MNKGILWMVIVGTIFVSLAIAMLLSQVEVFLSTIVAGIGVLILVIATYLSDKD